MSPAPRLLLASRGVDARAAGSPDLVLRRLADGATRAFAFGGDGARDMTAIGAFLGDGPGRVDSLRDQASGQELRPHPGTIGPMLLAGQTTDGLAGLLFDNGGAFEGAPQTASPAHRAVSLGADIAPPLLAATGGVTLVASLRLGNVASTAPAELLRLAGSGSPPLCLLAGCPDPSRGEVSANDLSLFGCVNSGLVPAPPSTPSAFGLSLHDGAVSVLVRGVVTTLPLSVPQACRFDRLLLGVTQPGSGTGLQIDALALFDRALGADELSGWAARIGPQTPSDDDVIVLDGSSVEAGMGCTGLRNQTRLYETAFPGFEIDNVAVGGATIADRLVALPGTLRLLLQARGRRVLLCGAGGNTLLAGVPAEAAYEQISAYVALARQAVPDARIGLATLIPALPALLHGQDGAFRRYNALVRANAAAADFISDRSADPVMGDAAHYRPVDPAISPDGMHPSDDGHRRLAAIDIAAIRRILSRA